MAVALAIVIEVVVAVAVAVAVRGGGRVVVHIGINNVPSITHHS